MSFLFNYIWILFLVIAGINAFLLKQRTQKYINKNPELKNGYDRYIRNYILMVSLPWIIMMIGSLTGMTHSIFEYFNPRKLNPIVLAFHAYIVVFQALSIHWIYFKNGAEFIEKHPGLFQIRVGSKKESRNLTAKEVKRLFPVAIAAGLMALIAMWFIEFPQPIF